MANMPKDLTVDVKFNDAALNQLRELVERCERAAARTEVAASLRLPVKPGACAACAAKDRALADERKTVARLEQLLMAHGLHPSQPAQPAAPAPRPRFSAGDVVKHTPSDEEWVLACDEEGEYVRPAGWPETMARASDCQIVRRASAAERLSMLERVANGSEGSPRRSHAREQLRAEGRWETAAAQPAQWSVIAANASAAAALPRVGPDAVNQDQVKPSAEALSEVKLVIGYRPMNERDWTITIQELEWNALQERLASMLARERRSARAEAFEEARKIALPAHADAIEGHGNAGNQYALRRMLADEFRALAAKERAS